MTADETSGGVSAPPTTVRHVYRALVMFPRSADSAEVDALIEGIAASHRANVGAHVTRNVGSLMGPGAQAGEARWILEADFDSLEDAMRALDAEDFQDLKAAAESLTSSIFLFELGEV
jgi:hypothetical protein